VTKREIYLVVDFLRERQPLFVGFGHTSNFSGLAARIVHDARPHLPRTTFVFGGVEATVNPELALRDCDYVCVGEGDDFIIEFISRLERAVPVNDLPNLAYLNGSGQLVQNPLLENILDLDRLPPIDHEPGDKWLVRDNRIERDGLPPHSLLRHRYATMTGRGCPFRCSYCCNSVFSQIYKGQYLRRHSVEYSINEILAHLERNPHVEAIEFYDDVFTINPKWIKEWAAEYKRRIGLSFCCYTYPSLVQREMLLQLKDAGLETLWMGIQSGSERTLKDVYERKGTQQQVIEAVDLISELKIDLLVDLIGTSAMESAEDKHATIDLLTRMQKPFRISGLGPLSFYPKYPIIEKARAAGVDLKLQPGRNVYLAEFSLEDGFYNSLSSMCQYPLSRKTVLKLESMPQLHENVSLLLGLEKVLENATFYEGTRMLKSYVIEHLAEAALKMKQSLEQIEDTWTYKLGRPFIESPQPSATQSAGSGNNGRAATADESVWDQFRHAFLANNGSPDVLASLQEITALRQDNDLLSDFISALHNGAYVMDCDVTKDELIEALKRRISFMSERVEQFAHHPVVRRTKSLEIRVRKALNLSTQVTEPSQEMPWQPRRKVRVELKQALDLAGLSPRSLQ